jgi:hypothetical protein
MAIAQLCEPRTRTELEAHGHRVADFGQGLVSEEARQLLRAAKPPDLGRWPADFRVITDGGLSCYVDAKFSYPHNRNVSIEMRSVLAARLQSVTWFYACSVWDGRSFSGFKAINIGGMPLDRGCCPSCLEAFHSSPDPITVNAQLPNYCSTAQQQGGSGTPYFLVMASSFPYGDLLFDRKPWTDPTGKRPHLPWCAADHPPCRFTAGSVWCVNDECGNPHHRNPPALSDHQGDGA